ncbi:hypothetical protein T492DRAFT_995909 [Pavlovales sp. CCMP2436]|nr:hypothetical protein T492DRAFT_995909 [Pavlovales sp. CCMP2436]|mmetsp:Transcript_15442/g.39174  ORF Transcript_15442/g.39174 Transcript_15442/m.39174 type:complete len:429 (+) Transcript_15442:89-1375(+)
MRRLRVPDRVLGLALLATSSGLASVLPAMRTAFQPDTRWLANNLRASRGTKTALYSRVPIRIVRGFSPLGSEDAAREREHLDADGAERARLLGEAETLLDSILKSTGYTSREPAAQEDSDEFRDYNLKRRSEYEAFYAPSKYSMAGCDLEVEIAARLVHDVLRLQPTDSLIDLGCSTGALCMIAALISEAQVHGLELSPSRIEDAKAMRNTLTQQRPDAAKRTAFSQGDLVDAPGLAQYTVLFCAVQPDAALKLMPAFMLQLLAAHRQKAKVEAAGAPGALEAAGAAAAAERSHVRFFCAGFDLPANVKGVTPVFVAAHVFEPRDFGKPKVGGGVASADDRGASLYGTRGQGPRMVLEYAVALELADTETAPPGNAAAGGPSGQELSDTETAPLEKAAAGGPTGQGWSPPSDSDSEGETPARKAPRVA